jgi:hypothetical protein
MCALLSVLLAAALLATGAAADSVRPAAVAGSWYPRDATELARYLDGQLDAAAIEPTPVDGRVRALIAPHAGYAFSGAVAARAYRLVRRQRYDRVVLLGPSHHADFRGLAVYDVDAFETPLGRIPLDRDAARLLPDSPLVQGVPAGQDREHSLEMQLPFLQRALAPGWRLLPLLVGRVEEGDYPALADALRPLLDDRTLVVASSDFTHYGPRFRYLPFPPEADAAASLRQLDMGAYERIEARDPAGFLAYQGETGITVCGYRPIALLLHVLPQGTRAGLVAYDTSGAQQGDYRHSVSYLAIAFTAPVEHAAGASLQWLHRLAVLGVRRAVEANGAVDDEIERLLAAAPADVSAPAGAFVTLRNGGTLRGCIGYVAPIKPTWEAVLDNAAAAAVRDPRFPPVSVRDLPLLEVEVSVLTEPAPIADWRAFEPGRDGIVLEKNGRRAVFLPEVATQQGWGREETLTRLAVKAGLPPDAWREGAKFAVFTSRTHEAPLMSAAAP